MRRERGESSYRHLLDEMCARLGVSADTDRERVRQVAQALGVPPPEHSLPIAILDLYHTFLEEES